MWRVGTVVALHDETATARTITLEVPNWPGHTAGQHVDVRLTASDGYSAVRSYSIASAPNSQGRVELTVERLPNGEVSPYLTQEVAIEYRVCEIRVVDERCLIAVAPFGVLWRSGCIFCDCYTTYTVR